MKLAIVGSRGFNDFGLLESSILANYNIEEIDAIVSGGAKGADTLAEQFAAKYHKNMIVFKPDWKIHGKGAGLKRNIQIVNACDCLIAFWDGDSTGTEDSINIANKQKKSVKIIKYSPT